MELEQICKEPQAIKRLVHDLKNPLSGIIGNAQVLLMDNLNPEQKETVEDILISSERLHQMVVNLLDIRQTEIRTANPQPLAYGKLLIVDDEKQTVTMVERIIRKLWPQVEIAQASDGIQAILIAEKFLPEIMILDLMLPGQDGFAVLNAFSRHPKLRSTLVLGMTAFNTPENINGLMERGAISCLMKPFGIEELKKLLSPYLNNSQTKESMEHEDFNGGNHQRKNSKLVDVITFLGLFFPTLQMSDMAEGSASKMVKNIPIEEQYNKEKLALLKKVAILPFNSTNLYIAGKSFSDTLIEHLTKRIPALSVIERPDIEKVLSEQKFILTGAVKQEKATNPGGIEPVDALITGTVRTMEYFGDDGGSIVVNVKIIDVENGKILWSHSQEARCYSIGIDRKELGEELMRRAAKKIAKKMKSDLFSKKRNNSNATGTVQAGPSHTTKATKMEESYKKNILPFKRIAVLPFESWNEYLSGNTLSDYFVHYFIQLFPEITVVERKELRKILKEQLFSQTGAISPETAASLGKILGVDALVMGKITTLDTIIGNKGAISIVYRIVDANTGQILWSDKQSAKMKPKLIQFESSYKSPTEVADLLLEQVAKKSISQIQSYFTDISRSRFSVSNL